MSTPGKGARLRHTPTGKVGVFVAASVWGWLALGAEGYMLYPPAQWEVI